MALSALKSVREVNQFLLDTREDYIDINRFVASSIRKRGTSVKHINRFTDGDRDRIDKEVQQMLKECMIQTNQFADAVASKEKSTERLSHYKGVINFITTKIQDVTQTFGQQRQMRVKQIEKKNSVHHLLPAPVMISEGVRNQQSVSPRMETRNEEEEMTSRERQVLEEENLLLLRELETSMSQTRKVEESVMEISQMMDTFVTKLMEQSEVIEHNHQVALQSKANVDQGARELRRAAQWSVDFRVFVLVFLLICSFSLLFLHHIT
ncbi:syntaxin-18 [Planoprotostelium fungivorum]|uniref:Syntaxin-18 n=1 Tax=Planoprotostelium fungivorum TaxID=1890364 RepID=A0A2P6MQ79_9EUKA|nr:syntaxin-18 [Planoprotostelium fungivorum]